MQNNKGQSLIEIIVVLAVVIAVVGGMVMVSFNSLKNSSFARNQIKATKYAQQGIDNVRYIRYSNCPITYNMGSYRWDGTGSLIWDAALTGSETFTANSTTCTMAQGTEGLIDNQFTRTINLTTFQESSKKFIKVSVFVKWNDVSGNHQSNLETVLSQ